MESYSLASFSHTRTFRRGKAMWWSRLTFSFGFGFGTKILAILCFVNVFVCSTTYARDLPPRKPELIRSDPRFQPLPSHSGSRRRPEGPFPQYLDPEPSYDPRVPPYYRQPMDDDYPYQFNSNGERTNAAIFKARDSEKHKKLKLEDGQFMDPEAQHYYTESGKHHLVVILVALPLCIGALAVCIIVLNYHCAMCS